MNLKEILEVISSLSSNAWVIGIVSSVISGLLIYWLTNLILSKKQKKDYFHRVNEANMEILYILRPLLVEKNIPEYDIVSSLMKSIARKYNVGINDIYTRESIVDDLCKEVLENPFLNATSKKEYCDSVKLLMEIKKTQVDNIPIRPLDSERNSENFKSFTLLFSIFASIITLLFAVFMENEKRDSTHEVIFMTALLTFSLSILIVLLTGNDRFMKVFRELLSDETVENSKKEDNNKRLKEGSCDEKKK